MPEDCGALLPQARFCLAKTRFFVFAKGALCWQMGSVDHVSKGLNLFLISGGQAQQPDDGASFLSGHG